MRLICNIFGHIWTYKNPEDDQFRGSERTCKCGVKQYLHIYYTYTYASMPPDPEIIWDICCWEEKDSDGKFVFNERHFTRQNLERMENNDFTNVTLVTQYDHEFIKLL